MVGLRSWFLLNNDTFEVVEGQFEPIGGTTRQIENVWVEHSALSRANPVLQFVKGQSQKVSLQVQLFQQNAFGDIEGDLAILEVWARADLTGLGRPAALTFWLGNSHLLVENCVIESLADITYRHPTFFGAMKDVTLTINLRSFVPFDIEATTATETRFHRARTGDYYESLAEREYKNPFLGDVIRKRHPTKPIVQINDIIKLPSIEAIRTTKVTQRSIALQTAYGKKETREKRLRLDMFDKRNRICFSAIVPEGL